MLSVEENGVFAALCALLSPVWTKRVFCLSVFLWSCTVFESYFVTVSVGDEILEALSVLILYQNLGSAGCKGGKYKNPFELLANLWKGVFLRVEGV